MKLSEFVKAEYGKSISECTNEELYYALLTLTKKMASGKQHGNSKKKIILYIRRIPDRKIIIEQPYQSWDL